MAKKQKSSGTKILNPFHRGNDPWFLECTFCGEQFTQLGLPRHWAHCPRKPKPTDLDRLKLQFKLRFGPIFSDSKSRSQRVKAVRQYIAKEKQ